MDITKVGIGLAVLRASDNGAQVLMGKRKGSHGQGEWSFPGGHLDYQEAFEDCALRELAEEVGPEFEVEDLRVMSVINLTEYDPKHYIDIGMMCWWVSGDPVVMEPEKCEGWEWFDIDDLPSPRFATIDRILQGCKNNYVTVFDKGETI
jgi:8-oxo-dGTP diphosphatase